MKRRFIIFLIILIILFFGTSFLNSQSNGLAVKYRPNFMSGLSQMGFYFQIVNNSSTAVNLEDLRLFYYFTLDNTSSFSIETDWTFFSYVELIYHKNQNPFLNGNDIIEINFGPGSGILNVGQTTNEIQVWITGGVSTCNNDFSYDSRIPASGPGQENRNIAMLYNNALVWGGIPIILVQSLIVSDGWYNNTLTSFISNAANNKKVRNVDNDRLEIFNSNNSQYLVYDFKDLAANTNFSSIENVTLKILHYEDIGRFDADDIVLSIGSGFKSGEIPIVLQTIYMQPMNGQWAENYFTWDIRSCLASISQLNDLELKLSFNNALSGMVRINKIVAELTYTWEGKYSINPIAIDIVGRGIDFSYGSAWVSLPAYSGKLIVQAQRGFDITTNLGNPLESFPTGAAPYYNAKYNVTTNLVHITRISGDRSLLLKFVY